jgi:hypothetical protein
MLPGLALKNSLGTGDLDSQLPYAPTDSTTSAGSPWIGSSSGHYSVGQRSSGVAKGRR